MPLSICLPLARFASLSARLLSAAAFLYFLAMKVFYFFVKWLNCLVDIGTVLVLFCVCAKQETMNCLARMNCCVCTSISHNRRRHSSTGSDIHAHSQFVCNCKLCLCTEYSSPSMCMCALSLSCSLSVAYCQSGSIERHRLIDWDLNWNWCVHCIDAI